MAAIVWADVVALAPEVNAIDDAAKADIIAYVNVALTVANFGGEDHPKTRLARIYLAAHLAAMLRRGVTGGGAAGPLVSHSAGGMSRSYAVMSSGSALSSTSYGSMYEELARTSLGRLPFTL